MIRAEDLRIGNLLENFLGEKIAVNTDTLKMFESGNFRGFPQPKPIKLTEEILLKCGFEKSAWDNYSTFRNLFCSDGCIVISLEHKYIEIGDLTLDIEIKYLHQLQNLYFALTGLDLEVSLE